MVVDDKAEADTPFSTLIDFHRYLISEIAKVGARRVGIAFIIVGVRGSNMVSSSFERTMSLGLIPAVTFAIIF